jgi:hypothetical protein
MSSCDLFQQCIQVQISLQFHKMAMRRMKKASAKKAKTAMKAMRRRKAKKVSKIGKKWQVFKGTRVKTQGKLKKADLIKSKTGKIVSRKQSLLAKKTFAKRLGKWSAAVGSARKQLGIKGFQAVGGKSTKGLALLKKARSLYKK